MNEDTLKKLRSKLPHGWQKQASDDLKLSRGTISAMVNGKQKMTLPVIDYIVDLAETIRDVERAAERKIKSL